MRRYGGQSSVDNSKNKSRLEVSIDQPNSKKGDSAVNTEEAEDMIFPPDKSIVLEESFETANLPRRDSDFDTVRIGESGRKQTNESHEMSEPSTLKKRSPNTTRRLYKAQRKKN